MHVTVIGPDPTMPDRKGGIAKFVSYQMEMNTIIKLNLEFIFLDWKALSGFPLTIKRLFGAIRVIFKLILKSKKLDCVHLHVSLRNKGAFKNFFIACLVYLKRYNLFVQIHGGRFNKLNFFPKKIWEFIFNKSERIGVFPGPQYQELKEKGYDEKLVKMANFIPNLPINKYRSDYRNPRFLFLGRVVKEKGVIHLIKSFLGLRNEAINAELIIAGSGSEWEQVKKIAMNSKFKKDIRIPGYVSGNELTEIMDKCNIFVLPSFHEGFPLSFLECSMKGMLPLITTNNGLPYFFDENKEYLKIDLSKKDDLLKKMKKVAIDENLRYEIGSKVQQKVKENFTIDTYSDTLYQIYKGLS